MQTGTFVGGVMLCFGLALISTISFTLSFTLPIFEILTMVAGCVTMLLFITLAVYVVSIAERALVINAEIGDTAV